MTPSFQTLITNIEILNKLEYLNYKIQKFRVWCLEFNAYLEIRNSDLGFEPQAGGASWL